jgi:hypothetical protein
MPDYHDASGSDEHRERPPEATRGDDCPMCGHPMSADDEVITCSECGGEGCTDHCIPGGRGTACVDCESDTGSEVDDDA